MLMEASLPNLELLEYIARQVLAKIEKEQPNKDCYANKVRPKLTAEVFVQMWGSTCTAFDVTKDGHPAIGGCAMTEAYTTVFHESHNNVYIVFVDNRLCYFVENPTEQFYADLKEHQLLSLSKAQQFY